MNSTEIALSAISLCAPPPLHSDDVADVRRDCLRLLVQLQNTLYEGIAIV